MTYAQREESDFEGTPERLFLFAMDSQRWGYVNAEEKYTYNSNEYLPTTVEMGDIQQTLSEDSPTINIDIDANAEVVQQFVPYQPISKIRVRVYRHHFDDADNEFKIEMIGEVINASFDEETGMCQVQVRFFASSIDRTVPWPKYQKGCNYILYGPGCRVDRNAFKTEAVITTIDANSIQAAEFGAISSARNDPRWFVLGYAIVVDTNESRWIVAQNDDEIILQSPFVTLKPGMKVQAFAGCDLLRLTCQTKFNNYLRYMGFPWGPQKNPFRDNVYGTGTPAGAGEFLSDGKNPGLGGFNNT